MSLDVSLAVWNWWWRWRRRRAGKDDKPALIPFHFKLGRDGDFGGDEGVGQTRVEDRRCASVARRRFAPEIRVRSGVEGEVVHAVWEDGV